MKVVIVKHVLALLAFLKVNLLLDGIDLILGRREGSIDLLDGINLGRTIQVGSEEEDGTMDEAREGDEDEKVDEEGDGEGDGEAEAKLFFIKNHPTKGIKVIENGSCIAFISVKIVTGVIVLRSRPEGPSGIRAIAVNLVP